MRLVAYAVPEPGWSKIILAFAATPAGEGIDVTPSYGAPATSPGPLPTASPPTRVNFSVEPDVTRLVKAGKVAQDWNAGVTKESRSGRWSAWWSAKATPRASRTGTICCDRTSRW